MKWLEHIAVGLICIMSGSEPLLAQASEAGEEHDKKLARVTFIALGADARRRFILPKSKGADGERLPEIRELEHGESPPAQLYLRQEKPPVKEDRVSGESRYQSYRVGFNRSVIAGSVSAGKKHVFYMRNESKGDDYKRYFTLPELAENSHVLVLLTQMSKRRKRWLHRPQVKLVRLDSAMMRKTELMLLNLSSVPVNMRLGEKLDRLLPAHNGQAKYRITAGKRLRVRASLRSDPPTVLMHTTISNPPHWLSVLIFYDADPATNSGKKVGVCRVLIEQK